MYKLLKQFLSLVLIIACTGFSGLVFSQSPEGYEIIDPPLSTPTEGKITIVELFSYGCPHCFRLESELHPWEENLADDVVFIREAPPLNEFWKYRSQAFYAAQELGLTDQLHQAYFNAIHLEGKKLKRREPILTFVGQLGFDKKAFAKAMDSDQVKTRLENSLALAKAAGTSGIPTIIINGKYRTGTRIAGDQYTVVEVLNLLIEKERRTNFHLAPKWADSSD